MAQNTFRQSKKTVLNVSSKPWVMSKDEGSLRNHIMQARWCWMQGSSRRWVANMQIEHVIAKSILDYRTRCFAFKKL